MERREEGEKGASSLPRKDSSKGAMKRLNVNSDTEYTTVVCHKNPVL